ncbi:MAG: ArsA-related P-loop ATPase [Bacteriovoracaceae bacterium]
MERQPRRLYIFSGKGGVGKTTLSKAFVRYLIEHDHEAVYITLKNQSIGEVQQSTTESISSGIREISLDLEDCARGYIEKKLNSKMIASWVVKTPFFKSLVNMVPGFSYLIYLGKILEMGNENPRLIVVLDAPASGHALTMMEATNNFQEIFESGIIFEDTGKMLSRLNDPEYTKINVISLPSLMSWQEAMELKKGLSQRTKIDIDITLNNCLYPLVEKNLTSLPDGLKAKALYEKTLIEEHKDEMRCMLPHSIGPNSKAIELDLLGSLSNLI